jgi:predicted nuclease of predicted toxin-antitoxin system
MLRLLTDENFNQDIVRGLNRRLPNLDLVSVRDVGLASTPDPIILDWAAQQDRAILTHDRKTMLKYAEQLLIRGKPMTGVVLVPKHLPIGHAIDDLQLVIECYSQAEMQNRIERLPL